MNRMSLVCLIGHFITLFFTHFLSLSVDRSVDIVCVVYVPSTLTDAWLIQSCLCLCFSSLFRNTSFLPMNCFQFSLDKRLWRSRGRGRGSSTEWHRVQIEIQFGTASVSQWMLNLSLYNSNCNCILLLSPVCLCVLHHPDCLCCNFTFISPRIAFLFCSLFICLFSFLATNFYPLCMRRQWLCLSVQCSVAAFFLTYLPNVSPV